YDETVLLRKLRSFPTRRSSDLNQLQGGIEKRYSSGLLVTAQYQFSRVLGTETYQSPINYNDSRGNLGNIRRHVMVMSYVYDLPLDRKSTRLNSSHLVISYAVFC